MAIRGTSTGVTDKFPTLPIQGHERNTKTMTTLSTSGVTNTVGTILSLIQRMSAAVAALPEVVGLIEAAISTFSNEDKAAVKDAYAQKMQATDLAHGQTQEVLAEKAAEGAGEPDESSPKGSGL